MTATALGARVKPALGSAGRLIAAVGHRPGRSLAVLIALQIGLALLLFARVETNGWLTYQGGDQLWLVTTGWLLGQGELAPAVVGPGIPILLAPLTWLTGPSSLDLLPLTTVIQIGLAGPVLTLGVYEIGTRIAGRVAGVWAAACVVVAPYAVTPLFVDRYEERWTDQVLVQAVGFTQLADFPSTVVLVVAAALVLRSLAVPQGVPEAVLAGAVAGFALCVKPANVLFLAGPGLAYLLARRAREAVALVAAFLPAVVVLAVWKHRGLGSIPVFALDEVRTAASATLGALPLGGYLDRTFDLDEWLRNMSNLREFFFSARVAQLIPFAGAFAIARIAKPAAGLLLGWVLSFFLIKGSSAVSSIENASFWRIVMPSLPAYVLLAAATPLLVPTLPRRIAPVLRPPPVTRGIRLRTAIGAAALVSLVPFAVVLLLSPLRGVEQAVVVSEILVPADGSVTRLTATREEGGVRLRWTDTTATVTTFYRVLRNDAPGSDVECRREGADRCELRMGVIGTTRERTFFDAAPVAGASYRVGVGANWLDDPEQGDIMVVTPAVVTPAS
jgi:hypothetical protein